MDKDKLLEELMDYVSRGQYEFFLDYMESKGHSEKEITELWNSLVETQNL